MAVPDQVCKCVTPCDKPCRLAGADQIEARLSNAFQFGLRLFQGYVPDCLQMLTSLISGSSEAMSLTSSAFLPSCAPHGPIVIMSTAAA
eukprot:1161102-Pelagomonas_calceolata.AAC.11